METQFPPEAYLGAGGASWLLDPAGNTKHIRAGGAPRGDSLQNCTDLGTEWRREACAPLKWRQLEELRVEHPRETQDQRRRHGHRNTSTPHRQGTWVSVELVSKRPSSSTQDRESTLAWVLELQLQLILLQMTSLPCSSAHAGPNHILSSLCRLP